MVLTQYTHVCKVASVNPIDMKRSEMQIFYCTHVCTCILALLFVIMEWMTIQMLMPVYVTPPDTLWLNSYKGCCIICNIS